ncbi:MAG: hypothetical protein GWP17_06990 [Aquificales bacterium]|nr:hypothetical protein [Aquificales bacterium]
MNENKNLLLLLGEWQQTRQQANPALRRSYPRWLPTPGNIIFTLVVVGLLILTQRVWATPGSTATNATSASATTINYQGRLAAPLKMEPLA